MAEQSAMIVAAPGGELARAINAAAEHPVVVDKDGIR